MRFLILSGLVGVCLLAETGKALDYVTDVLPIMKARCWECHSNEHQVKGNVALDDFDEVRDYQIGKYNIIRPGDPDESSFLERLKLDAGHTDFMPRKAEPLSGSEIQVIEEWIRVGAVVDKKQPDEEEQVWVTQMGNTTSAEGTPEYLNWESSDGKVIEARFDSRTATAVTVVMLDGRSFEIPFSRLSEKSVDQAKQFASATAN